MALAGGVPGIPEAQIAPKPFAHHVSRPQLAHREPVNVRSTVHLAKRMLRMMADRNDGKVLVTSSIASTMPGSFQAVYNASKSFLQSFAEALQNELKDTDVTITSLMPGPTETNFFNRAHMGDTKVGQMDKDDPAEVAKQGFEALMKGKDKIVAGSMKTKARSSEQGAPG